MKFFGYELSLRRAAAPPDPLKGEAVAAQSAAVADEPGAARRGFSLTSPEAVDILLGGAVSAAGVRVSEERVLGVAPFWGAVRVVAGSMASVSLDVYREDEKGMNVAKEHPVRRFFRGRPHPMYTRSDFFFAWIANAMFGNGYARIYRDGMTQRPYALEVLPSELVEPEIDDYGQLWYNVTGWLNGNWKSERLPDTEMLHIRGFTMNGVMGKRVCLVHRENLGSALASQDYTANYFGNGAHPSGIFMYNDVLPNDERVALETKIGKKYGGMDNSGKVMVLDSMQKFQQVQSNPVEAALIDFRHLNVDDVSRITGVPPHLLANLERSTNNNIEYQSSEFVRYCLNQWVSKVQDEVNTKLFWYDEQGEYFLKFDLNSLLMADMDTQAEFARTVIQNGIMTQNEVRQRLFGLNPMEGADKLLIQLNMTHSDNLDLMAKLKAQGKATFDRDGDGIIGDADSDNQQTTNSSNG